MGSLDSNAEGNERVEMTTIDEFSCSHGIGRVDYIKIDAEGFEKQVILGAKKLINRDRPKLALSIYHNTEDLITLPALVSQFNSYDLFIRSNLEGAFGFTLFCSPANTNINSKSGLII